VQRQQLTCALLTAIRSVGRPKPWVAVAALQVSQLPNGKLYDFLTQGYEVLRMALSMLPDEGMLGTAREILDRLLQPVQQ
jgi:hypothetical protein